ncbi:MAG: hypothetical protein KF802_02005 [Bdellovibrionaceae bacterium]|nr:hypothetical protein [Pseudobdellovibrionaceae bacterium]MBX3033909.1 hypothetical protein [Pseudobdellovibrionaceae bacterium]
MRRLFPIILLMVAGPASLARANFTVSPSQVNFGRVAVGQMAVPQSVFVSSQKNEETRLTVSNWSCTQDFQIWPAGCYSPMPPYGNCIFQVRYRPLRAGFHSCVVQVRDQYGLTSSVMLAGTGEE